MLTKDSRDRGRRMLADKQGAKAIAALISEAEGRTVTAKEIEALAPPKGALSAFMMFANEHRLAMQEKGAETSMASVTREASAQWKEVEDKSKYEALAEEDKERHDEEMATYRELLQSEAVEDRKAAGPSASAAPSAATKGPNPDMIRKQLWERAGLKGAIRKFTPAERQTWTPLAQEKFREHKRMRDEGYANGQMLLWLAAHADMPEPPKKAPRSAYVMFSAERCEAEGCSMSNSKELKKIGAEWKALGEEAQQPWVAKHGAAKDGYEAECEAHEAALEKWRESRPPPVEGVPICACAFCVAE
mmetsp:Transcript_5927/g.14249  ORF Transcript_5927/g.14249 Transcript_5927/m.14249 type:complete len:304 (-) Transcript_5927:268-1179(-)